MHAIRRLDIILNPISGRRRMRRFAAAFVQRLERTFKSVRLFETRGRGDAAALAARSTAEPAETRADVLVVVGGDGTVREAADGLISGSFRPIDDREIKDVGPPILIVPCGTENVLAKYFGLAPDEDLLLDAMQSGRLHALNVSLCNQHRFLFVAGVGFDSEIVRRVEVARRGHSSYFSYVRPVLQTLWNHDPATIRVDIDGIRVFEGRGLFLAGNISRYALGLEIFERADPGDGLLDVVILAYRRQFGLLWHALRMLSNQHVGATGVYYGQGRAIRVESDRTEPLQLDGDLAGATPIEITVLRQRVQFLTRQ
ncbi:MAG: hypothetical protein KF841_01915 [Phycisphaerae bacterium]|nr:hypothetical protein [Phycisphaerae bacterium]